MTTSWDEDGTESKQCWVAGGPFAPNCFAGHIGNDGGANGRDIGNVYPTVSIGTNDAAIEFWLKRTLLNTYNDLSEIFFFIGPRGDDSFLLAPRDDQTSAFFFGDAATPQGDWDNSAGMPVGWHHYVVRADRSGNLTLLIDGLDTGVAEDISADVAYSFTASLPFWFLGSAEDDATGAPLPDVAVTDDPGGTYPDSLTDPFDTFTFPQFPGILGPVAIHVGTLMTAAQIQASIKGRTVQSLGASTTKLRMVWTDTPAPSGGWDQERRHIIRGISDRVVVRIAAPLESSGTITVPDSSGNGNDLVLATAGAYGQIPFGSSWPPASWATPLDGRRSRHAFGSDPFFATAGGVRDLNGL